MVAVGTRPLARRLAVLAVAAALAVTGCADDVPPSQNAVPEHTGPASPPDARIPGNPLLLVGMDGRRRTAQPVQLGSAEVELKVSSVSGGQIQAARGREGDSAFGFPAYQDAGSYPRAVITARGVEREDELSPGASDFSYGADFVVDDPSFGRAEDNGNNVIQRGLSSDPVLFKLELDANSRPSCSVHGRKGALTVYARQVVETGRWLRVICEREGERLLILVSEYLPSGSVTTSGRAVSGTLGPVDFRGDVPVSIGGKVARDGSVIASSSDQFNGRIANPFVLLQ